MCDRPGVYAAAMLAVLALSSCSSNRPLQQQEARDAAAGEGVVIGSVSIRGGQDVLGRTQWQVAAKSADPAAKSTGEYVIDVHRNGKEELFVTTMPAGRYQVHELRQTAFSTFRMPINAVFQVRPGQVTYIGRLAFDFPPGLITVYSPVRMSVEDAKASAIAEAGTRFRKSFNDAATELMAIGRSSPSKLPGDSTANELLERDTLRMMMAMDGAEDQGCKERHVVNREVLSASSTGAEERWTLTRCSKPVKYLVRFSPDPRGGTTIGMNIER